MSKTDHTQPPAKSSAPRLGATEVARALLHRGGNEHDSVTIARNARGFTQFEVVVRTNDGTEVETIEQAAARAVAVFEDLRAKYPVTGDAEARP